MGTDADAKEDCLWIADPKILHRILQATGYLYGKQPVCVKTTSFVTDNELVRTDGTIGLKFRLSRLKLIRCVGGIHVAKGMMPAFGLTTFREHLPRFVEVIDEVITSRECLAHGYMKSETARWNADRHLLELFKWGPVAPDAMAWVA